MGFLQKLQVEKNQVFCDIRNINFITCNKEKTGCILHTTFTFDKMVNVNMLPEAVTNVFRGQFIKVVCTRMHEREDNSAFYKFHAWINTANLVFMKNNEIFEGYTDVKFVDGTNLIVCSPSSTIIKIMSELKKSMKENRN
jgi:hypothetical protein